ERGFTRLALTDTDNLYGLWPFLKNCERAGITPIVGAEVTEPDTERRAICLVENDEGYRNLCRLLTRRHQDEDFSLESTVMEHASGLVTLTDDCSLLLAWHEAGMATAAALINGPNGVSEKARSTARYLGLPAVAMPGSYFLDPEDYELHRVLRSIDLNTSLSRLKDADTASPSAWLANLEEYRRRFAIWPEALAASHEIAERLTFTGPDNTATLPPWYDPDERDAADVLRAAAYKGARGRYGNDLTEAVVERLEHELTMIEEKFFSTYFLVVQDIVQRSPRICGRGSGAASLVAYCLGITNVCPLKHNLFFERFLNPDRTDPPDIDVDFAWDERDDVLESVLEQYAGHAAMVCNHVTIKPRMAIREVAKVFGLTDGEIGQVAKRLPWFWRSREAGVDLKARLEALPEMRDLDFPDPWPEILQIAQKIVGTPRYLSVHSGGMIITPRPISEYVPIEKAPKGVPIVQWEKDGSEDGGLVKIDLLGNRSLAVIRDAVANVLSNGEPFDEAKWEPEDDSETQEAIARGRTMGCFYIESPATRLLQQKAGTGDFEHVVIHSSIIRPAANEFIQEYLRRLKGGEWDPIHPLLDEILDETYGIMVYQEDVSKVAVAIAGFSFADADGLRKVMSKKDKELALRDYRERFFQGARERGVSESRIGAVWDMIMSFGGYSFCKPHSASYARVSFQSAYLKVHFPAEFMAAVISNQGGFYSAFAYVSEARRMGVTVLPPDVNLSGIHWKGRKKAMRVGLMAIKGLSGNTQERIITSRTPDPYTSFDDFYVRVRPDEAETRSLIHAGALDSLAPDESRSMLLWKLARRQRDREHPSASNQTPSLFATWREEP
ncbi:MAG: DNA polymerase III subunit alpha, partial [Deltaproteobacteria bacterium]|nr:DNA polymerase III subunit alpha [Deltaproteobacteria bacterium]